jgi:DNA polymerase III gamma/tau subunit
MLTTEAQNSLLKELEDTRDWTYFILCTTNPNKLIKTIKNRCTEIKVRPLFPDEMKGLIHKVIRREEKDVKDEAVERIIELADGSPRMALVLLNQIINLKPAAQLGGLERAETVKQAKDLFNALLNDNFATVCTILPKLDEEPEQLRRYVLAAAGNVFVKSKGKNKRSYNILNAFRDNFYDSGKAGLIAACFESFG